VVLQSQTIRIAVAPDRGARVTALWAMHPLFALRKGETIDMKGVVRFDPLTFRMQAVR
jgi:hypothetical protein